MSTEAERARALRNYHARKKLKGGPHHRTPSEVARDEGVTDLSRRMLARAKADGLDDSHVVPTLARSFDFATAGFTATPQTVSVARFFAEWRDARKAWRDYSGETILATPALEGLAGGLLGHIAEKGRAA